MHQRIWIVGGSKGIGLELVKQWLIEENKVVVSARNAEASTELFSLKEIYPSHLKIIDIDVFSLESISTAVSEAWEAFDGLDIWFYNAGTYQKMRVKEWSVESFESMMEVNYLGAVRVMTQLMPYFEAQKFGRWVWNASLSSYFGLPYGGAYSASKAALVNLAESLHPELKKKGIQLQVINHGFVKTRLTANNNFAMPQLMESSDAAKSIIHAMKHSKRFEIHFPFKLAMVLRILNILPYRFSLALTQKMLLKEK